MDTERGGKRRGISSKLTAKVHKFTITAKKKSILASSSNLPSTMANQQQFQMFDTDIPNMSNIYTNGLGTTLSVAQPDHRDVVTSFCNHIEDGRINVTGVIEAPVAQLLVRRFVEQRATAASTANGRRPPKVALNLTPTVAALATNVTSVRRVTTNYHTIGAIETRVQFTKSNNQLTHTIGAVAFQALHRVLETMHNYGKNTNDDNNAGLADSMVNAALALRDALCAKLGLPQQAMGQLNQAGQAVMSHIETIRARDDTIAQLTAQLDQANDLASQRKVQFNQADELAQLRQEALKHSKLETATAKSRYRNLTQAIIDKGGDLAGYVRAAHGISQESRAREAPGPGNNEDDEEDELNEEDEEGDEPSGKRQRTDQREDNEGTEDMQDAEESTPRRRPTRSQSRSTRSQSKTVSPTENGS